MISNLQYIASAGSGGNLFSSLGIDWQSFVLQTIAFLVLLWVLKKWVYPPILGMLDKRDKEVEDGLKAAAEAKKAANEAEDQTAKLLKKAREESQTIVATAKSEASDMITKAEKKAKDHADAIVASARSDMQAEISQAKKDLRSQMIDLVAETTKKVTLDTVDASKDKSLIEKQLGEIK